MLTTILRPVLRPISIPGARPMCRCMSSLSGGFVEDSPMGPNDVVAPRIKNRNPMNLEKMRIGYKPTGFLADKGKRNYWNGLTLSISGQHTTASVKHWSGRKVCSASTREWAIHKFLYSNTDIAAVKIVAKVLAQRCLETGITEVKLLLVDEKSLEKAKMKMFLQSIEESGLALTEPEQFVPNDPFRNLANYRFKARIKPWEVTEDALKKPE